MQMFWATLCFNIIFIVAFGGVEVVPTLTLVKVEGAIADMSMNKEEIKIVPFIVVSPSQIFEQEQTS